jgi:hypothetical protein
MKCFLEGQLFDLMEQLNIVEHLDAEVPEI